MKASESMGDDKKKTSEDENPVKDEIKFEEEMVFEEEMESLPLALAIEDDSEKGNKISSQEDWGDSVQEIHLENMNKSLNQINSNLGKFKYVSKNLSRISDNFEDANVYLWWIAFALLVMLSLMILGFLMSFVAFSGL